MSTIPSELITPLADLLLSLADDKLMLGHRNADWTGLGPILEEDIAFSSIAQDELAHAQAIYELVASLQGGRADAIAYGRSPDQYRCAALVEVADEFDWARALLRQYLCDHFDAARLERLAQSSYPPLGALAARLRAEEQIHLAHGEGWLDRLCPGTEESRGRMQAALEALAPYAAGLCQPTRDVQRLEAAGLYPGDTAAMNRRFLADCAQRFTKVGLRCPAGAFDDAAIPAEGGRSGRHHACFTELLDELCEVYRLEPNAAW